MWQHVVEFFHAVDQVVAAELFDRHGGVAVTHQDAGHVEPFGGIEVGAAVADHHGIGRVDRELVEHDGDVLRVRFHDPGIAADHRTHERFQAKSLDHGIGAFLAFVGADAERYAISVKITDGLDHGRVDAGKPGAARHVMSAEALVDPLGSLIGHATGHLHGTVDQPGPAGADHFADLAVGETDPAQFGHDHVEGIGDVGGAVDQGAVEIKDNGAKTMVTRQGRAPAQGAANLRVLPAVINRQSLPPRGAGTTLAQQAAGDDAGVGQGEKRRWIEGSRTRSH